MATNFQLKPFRFNLVDLNFIKDQINFRPLFDSSDVATRNILIGWDGTTVAYDIQGTLLHTPLPGALPTDQAALDAVAAHGASYASLTAAQGLRDVTGQYNNLLLVNKYQGAVDQPFLQTVASNYTQYVKPLEASDVNAFYATKSFNLSATNQNLVNLQNVAGGPDYTKVETGSVNGGNIVDYTPRMISQLITTGGSKPLLDAGGQVVHWNPTLYAAGTNLTYNALIDSVSPGGTGLIAGATVISDFGILAGGQTDPQDPGNGEVFFGSVNPGVAPGNSFLAYFGQFFDHGLDFVGKGGGLEPSKITIPLALDDPLYRAPGTNGPGDQGNTKIIVSRADISGFDANGNAQWVNHTSPYIDQSQTYGSHSQITSLLREWVSTDGGITHHAGAHMLDGQTMAAAWINSWGESTHNTLPTLGELNAHLIATGRDPLTWDDVLNLRNRDADGNVTAGNSNQALLLDMNPHFDTAHFSATTEADLALMGILPDVNGNYALGGPNSLGTIINFATFGPMAGGTPQATALANAVLFDSVSDHYIAGDGRANENVALTTIHHVFHEEHNFQVRNIQDAIIAQDARAVALGDNSHSIAHDWQVVTAFTDAAGNYLLSTGGAIAWDEGKLFDAAKLTVEMEYQHAAVDQYARTITPDIAEFVGYNSGTDSTVSLEYAQNAFRFGHSTMRETIDTLDPNGSITGKVMSLALEQAFLNPALFAEKGAASIALGLTHQQMNEIDELLTPAMNTGLLGQPLDLAAINIARGRDIGLPTLNDFREAIGLTRYADWADFEANMVHSESLVNFIAAYSFDGDIGRASAIIGLRDGMIAEGSDAAYGYTVDDAIAFLNGGDTGYNHIDTWIGGLAEVHIMGGLLGETFNAVFVDQITRLMDGDRFYYLYRLNNLNMGDEIANAQLKDIVERNTGVEHLNGSIFAYADKYIDLSASVDTVNTTDTGNYKADHKYATQLAANPTMGVFTTNGTSINSNGSVVTVGGVQYVRDLRVTDAGDPTGLDGASITGANANEVLVATDNKDLIYMWAGDDTVYGEGANDIIYGGGGIDRLYGGDGDDTIYGGDSGDLIDGGAGDDTLWGESSGTAAAGLDQVIGGEGNDIIHGGIGIDKISGGAGDDVIYGEGETDAFTHGGDGNDYIDGGAGGDLLWGDDGDDLIVGKDDQDIVAGLNGDDILRPGNPSQAMGGGPDEVMGGAADGLTDLGNDGKGFGFDTIDFSDWNASATGVTIDFTTQQNPAVAIDMTSPFPAWIGVEGAIGSQNNDTILGDAAVVGVAANNWLIGGSGNDSLSGASGNDLIIGDGIRLDSLIGTYSGAYNHNFDGASHRAFDAASPAADRVIGGLNALNDQAALAAAAIVTANAQAALTAAGLVVAVDAAAVVVANDAVILEAANLDAVTLAEAPAAAAAAAAVIAATGLLGTANTAALTANATATASAAAVVTATTNAANAAAAALAADAALVAAANTANNDAAAATVANNAVVTAQAALDAAIVVGDLAAIDAATIALTNATNAANAANTTAAASADVVVTATADAANAAMATAAADALLVTATNDAGVDAAAATAANDAVVVATDNLAIANDAVAASAAVVAAAQATLDAATLVLDAATATAAASSANATAAAVAVEAAAANVAAIADSPEQGLLAKVGFENHYTTMLQSAMFKDMELGGSTVTTLLGGGTIGDGGVAGTDTAKFAGNKADYTITSFQYVTANQGEITVYKIVDNVGPLGTRLDVNGAIVDDGTDVLVGVEFAQFADQTTTLAPIAPANDAPVITSDAGAAIVAKTMAEETTAVATITATDANGDALTYSISGGADAAMFTINAAGELSFITAPSFEAPTDIGANRVYDVMVKVSDGTAHDFQSIAVTVTNVDEAATGSMGISGASMNALGTIGTINGFNTMVDPDGTSNFLKYQWQKQVGATWVNIAGAAGKSANLVTTAAGVAGALNAPNVLHLASAYTDPFGNKTFVSDQTVYVGSNSTTAETFSASGGNDVVLGLSGNDTITAGAGNDQVDGGAGNDIFMATLNDGDDAYVGGLGIDTYNLSGTSAAADVNLTAGTASSLQTGTDTLSGIENVTGSSGNNVITDSNVANNLVGGAGNDTFVMLGDNFRDVITGGTNVDTVNYSSTTANLNVNLTAATAVVNGTGTTAALSDTVNGVENFVSGSGNDIIIGSSVANALNGGDGDDTLTGGAGKDTLTGGAGADVFDYNLTTETGNNATLRDVITDFVQGADIIDLSGIDANTGVVGNDAFIFNLTPFFNGPGEITVFYQNVGAVEHTVIEGNVNAALSTDFQIALVGHHNLTAADFVL